MESENEPKQREKQKYIIIPQAHKRWKVVDLTHNSETILKAHIWSKMGCINLSKSFVVAGGFVRLDTFQGPSKFVQQYFPKQKPSLNL